MVRGNFGSRLGIVLATAGSAVGLGNVWRFPYMAGQNGGAAFILIYVVCILLLGLPAMISEFVVGRHAQRNAARAYAKVGRHRAWGLVGLLGILCGATILGFYAVVAGWCLHYLFTAVTGSMPVTAEESSLFFSRFSSGIMLPCLWAVGFILITHVVVSMGVQRGIERASKVLMPLLFLLLLVLVVASCSLPGAWRGVEFLFRPDFSRLDTGVWLEALGQAFFSLSLGTACLCTYASYYSRDTWLPGAASQIVLLDTLVAVLSGLAIFPAAFSVGVTPDAGPSLIFITLPGVFSQAFSAVPFLGAVLQVAFYALLVFAALTSTISMHEIGTAFFSEELHLSRPRAAALLTLCCSLLAVVCALSVGARPDWRLFGLSIMDFCDHLTAQFFLPVGALMTTLLIGWRARHALVRREFMLGQSSASGSRQHRLFRLWLILVKWVVPVGILLIFLHQLGII